MHRICNLYSYIHRPFPFKEKGERKSQGTGMRASPEDRIRSLVAESKNSSINTIGNFVDMLLCENLCM